LDVLILLYVGAGRLLLLLLLLSCVETSSDGMSSYLIEILLYTETIKYIS